MEHQELSTSNVIDLAEARLAHASTKEANAIKAEIAYVDTLLDAHAALGRVLTEAITDAELFHTRPFLPHPLVARITSHEKSNLISATQLYVHKACLRMALDKLENNGGR